MDLIDSNKNGDGGDADDDDEDGRGDVLPEIGSRMFATRETARAGAAGR